MKLIFCPECSDIVRLFSMKRYCRCYASWGRYVDDLNAEIFGKAMAIGIDNITFKDALKNQPEEDNGPRFIAFVFPRKCPTVTRK